MKDVNTILMQIVQMFEDGAVPEAIALTSFPPTNIPSESWSYLNRFLMFLVGTEDARGFKQWKQANRNVKKGAKAFYILAPRVAGKKTVTNENTGEERQVSVIRGFFPVPVFKVEDTEGEALPDYNYELPEMPLIDKAKSLGIDIQTTGGNKRAYGWFTPRDNKITLASPEEIVFFHELAHAVSHTIPDKPDRDLEEITAELTGLALCHLIGLQTPNNGQSFNYIKAYATKKKLSVSNACLSVLSRVEKIIKLLI